MPGTLTVALRAYSGRRESNIQLQRANSELAAAYQNRFDSWPRDTPDATRRVYEALRSLYSTNDADRPQSLQISREDLNFALSLDEIKMTLAGIGAFNPQTDGYINIEEVFMLAGTQPMLPLVL